MKRALLPRTIFVRRALTIDMGQLRPKHTSITISNALITPPTSLKKRPPPCEIQSLSAKKPRDLTETARNILFGLRLFGGGKDLFGRTELDQLAKEHKPGKIGHSGGLLHIVGDNE